MRGTTTNVRRPSAASARTRCHVPSRSSGRRMPVRIAIRPSGAVRRVDTSRSAYRTWPRVRGIGVAVMSRTCGAPFRAFASRAPRCSTPNRCCSSTTASARSANATASWSIAWVPTTTRACPVARASYALVRPFAPSEPVSRITSIPRSSSSPPTTSRCCRARRSVGASSAACRPSSAAAASAQAATAVLPEPTSPWTSRSIGTSRARSSRTSSRVRAWSGVSEIGVPHLARDGGLEGRPDPPVVRPGRPGPVPCARDRGRAAARPCPAGAPGARRRPAGAAPRPVPRTSSGSGRPRAPPRSPAGPRRHGSPSGRYSG